MRTIRLFATSLLVALCVGLSSCGGDEFTEEPLTPIPTNPTLEDVYSKYINDYENMTCKRFNDNGDIIEFTGITAKGYLMINLFQEATKTKVFDWVDNVKTDTIYKVYKGYGEYEEITVKSIGLSRDKSYMKSNKDFITLVDFYGGTSPFTRILFVNDGKSKMSNIMPVDSWSIRTFIPNWYNNEYSFIHDCCYTLTGDTVYTIKYDRNDFYDIKDYEDRIVLHGSYHYKITRISNEEGIGTNIANFSKIYQFNSCKINYKDYKKVWECNITLPFDYEANAKLSYSIVDDSSDIWEYKANITYYDGTKNEVTFNININEGTIIEKGIPITLTNLKGTWDMVKCYGWEYNDDDVKEDWTEDVTGEYIFFEDEDGNGGFNDGYKTYYFASSIDGNKLVLRSSEWLQGKAVTITKLTSTELHITATDAVSEENYEMKRR
ncbi:hypothetical protein [uncultured Bacteroides sp.]|uniref:hypothetical protein n=1 Tax=uncultured Bacteroides sp. TaxID=162156 RepID=UPI0025F8DF79|nr:hypothetical protein [uncultured Bacteroides sp.]